MDDSDQDFSSLCSRLLKRVKRKDAGDERKPAAARDGEESGTSPSKAPPRRKRQKNAQPRSEAAGTTQPDGASSCSGVKEKVLRRMERFKRGSPARLQHVDTPTSVPTQEPVEEPNSDEALAQRLQQQLDREAADQGAGDVNEGALFFCQLCHKDLSAMSPQLRAQHINRCLDASENSAPEALHPAPPRPQVPECPICGRAFKSEKSRSTHLKRCSASMGVSPAELLLAVQRQAADSVRSSATDQREPSGSSGRGIASQTSVPVKKKPRRRAPRADEDTMVALALSRSLLEQEKERERAMEEERQIQAQLSSPPAAAAPVLQWRPGAGKSRKRRRGGADGPPPLLLAQDRQTALDRIQERVSSLLLGPRPPTPPSPILPPSTLPAWTHSAPLWVKSALPGGGPDSACEFYCPDLGAFIQPWVRLEKKPHPSSELTPVKRRSASAPETSADREEPSARPASTVSTPGSQALQDLVELAEEGMTLTQYRQTGKELAAAELPLSGFVPEATGRATSPERSVSVTKLCSDLAAMVNNPQLSDVQLQVDSGNVYFAHSFMLYTRCPLLANMVHDAGFGVQEDGMPAAQRVLLGDVPGEAVRSLLQYLYTASCPLSQTLLPHVLQLATRFGLPELQQQCEQYSEVPEDPSEEVYPAQEPDPGPRQSLAETQFLELLRSMWQHEECNDVEEAGGADRGPEEEEDGDGSGDAEDPEERVDEEELNEIYEFAATQRKMETTAFTATSTEEEEEVSEHSGAAKRDEEQQNTEAGRKREADAAFFMEANTSRHSYRIGEDGDAAAMATSASHHTQSLHADVRLDSDTHGHVNADASLDRSYNRLFSQSWGEYVEPSQAPATSSQHHKAPQKYTSAPRLSSASEVIDLSISPPPASGEPGEASLPVAGISPGEGEAGKPSVNTVPPCSPSTLHNIHSVPSPPAPTASSKISSPSPGKPGPGLSPSMACNPELSPSVPNPPPPDQSPSRPTGREPELIVLSDSSDDLDLDPPADKVSPQGGASTPSPSKSPPRLRQSYTKIKVKDVPHSSDVMDESERFKPDQSEGGPSGSGGPSLLDGSAEVSWLIPATPEASTRSSSTQTHSGMRRIRLFPLSRSSSSSGSVPDHSETSRYANAQSSLRKDADSSGLHPDQCSSRDRPGRDVPKRPPAFQTPQFTKQTHPSALMPSSSTPLHSTPCPQPPEPLGSPLLKDCKLKPQSRASWEEDDGYEEEAALSLSQRAAPAKTMSQIKLPGLGSMHLGHSKSPPSQPRHSEPGEDASELPPGDTGLSQTEPDITGEMGTRENEQGRTEEEENGRANEAETVEEASFCAFDEPPIAFDDSWGLGGGAAGDQGPCFSLRLESSGDPAPGDTTAPHTLAPPGHTAHDTAPLNHSLPDPGVWDSWGEDDDDDDEDRPALPLSKRVGAVAPPQRVAQLKTPVARKKKNPVPLVPITPMPGYSDMDTPELKKRLDRYGVRPLPKKQMVLKLKEIHQYTHQLMSSESEEEASPMRRPQARLPLTAASLQPALSFKQPTAPPPVSPRKVQLEEEEHNLLPASQDSNTSSTAESERSNPELCDSEDDGSDGEGFTASQAAVREKDKLLAVRSFILSDPALYGRVLQYQPLSLSDLKAKLKAAGIRLGTAKLLDFLDSQCITFTTAKPGRPAPSRRRARAKAPAAGPRGAGGRGRKRTAKPPD